MSKHTKIMLVLIVTLGAFLRFYALDRIPPGVYPDEAIKGIEGLEAAETGNFKLFYETNNGREGLWINMIGVAERVFGVNQFSLRFWAALCGTLTVLGLGLLATELFSSDRIGLFSAFFLATSFWHLNFSRIAFRAIMVPLLMVWSFYFLLLALRKSTAPHASRLFLHQGGDRSNPPIVPGGLPLELRKNHNAYGAALVALLGGLLFGLGFHTYIAFRFAPFVGLVLMAVEFLRIRKAQNSLRPFLTRIAWWLGGAALTALPMGLYFFAHPQDFFGRAGNVSIFSTASPLRTFAKVLVQTMGMFNIRGDCNWRHNMSCSPQLLLPIGLLFLIGVWLALRNLASPDRKVKNHSYFLFAWMAFLLAPELLTWEGIPHALRSIGVIPPVMIFSALGVNYLLEKFSNKKIIPVMVIVIVMVSGAIEPYRYFGVWAKNFNTPYAFAKPYVEIGRYFNSLPPSTPKYVIVNAYGVLAPHKNPDGEEKLIPVPAQTVMYTTLKHTPATYLLPKDIPNYTFPAGSVIVPLDKDERFFEDLRKRGIEVAVLKFQYFDVGMVE